MEWGKKQGSIRCEMTHTMELVSNDSFTTSLYFRFVIDELLRPHLSGNFIFIGVFKPNRFNVTASFNKGVVREPSYR